MPMLHTAPQHAQVRNHYRGLAQQYNGRANRTCEQAYLRLVQRFLSERTRLLELGSGSTDLLDRLEAPLAVACDLSIDMLRERVPCAHVHCVVAAGERLPFPDGCFDGLFLINVLEHVSDVGVTMRECSRVLQPGGRLLAVTPNGNWEFWLDLAERWSLKIPEGPHVFLSPRQVRQGVEPHLEVVEQRTFLVLPMGPFRFAGFVDWLSCCGRLGWGFFQYILAQKRWSGKDLLADTACRPNPLVASRRGRMNEPQGFRP